MTFEQKIEKLKEIIKKAFDDLELEYKDIGIPYEPCPIVIEKGSNPWDNEVYDVLALMPEEKYD